MKNLFLKLNFIVLSGFVPVYAMELQKIDSHAIQAEVGMNSLPDDALKRLMSFSTEEDKNALKCVNKFYSEHDFPSKSLIIGKKIRSLLSQVVEASMNNSSDLFDMIAKDHSDALSIVLHNNIDDLLSWSDLDIPIMQRNIIFILKNIISLYVSSSSATLDDTALLLNSIGASEEINSMVNNMIIDTNFNEFFPLSFLTDDDESGINIKRFPDAMKNMVLDILSNYLNSLNIDYKKRIIMAYLQLDPYSSKEDTAAAVFSEVGPIVQKLFQLIGQNSSSVVLKKAMEKLQNNLRPISLDYSLNLIQKALGNKFALFDGACFKNLGTASIGQAILITTVDNKEFVAKIRKPNICEKVKEDHDILINYVLQDPASKKLLGQVYTNILQELDFTIEAKHLKSAACLYNKTIEVNPDMQEALISAVRRMSKADKNFIEVPEIQDDFVYEDIIIMSKAAGSPIATFNSPEQLKVRLEALSGFFAVWFAQAITGNGFFHGDPHAGNIFLDMTKDYNSWTITPIDFGACSSLNLNEQDSVVRFSLGMEWNNVHVICSAIHNLSEGVYDQKHLRSKVVEILAEEKDTSRAESLKQNKIMSLLHELGITMSESFVLFMRGKVFLEQQINHVVNELGLNQADYMFNLIKETIKKSVGLKSLDSYKNAAWDSLNDHRDVACVVQ